MFWQVLFLLLYILAAIRLDLFYNNRYFWNQNCRLERFATSAIQPLMEIFGNSMTAHFWHFENFKMDHNCFDHDKYILQLHSNKKPFRKLNNIPLVTFFTSAFVDINPLQSCAIIQPKSYIGKWKLVFARDWSHDVFSIEKCSHIGPAKVVVDGAGGIIAVDQQGELIELELVRYCKAWQHTEVLYI
jgi:hypothetical protein